jgi:hypothetical protein
VLSQDPTWLQLSEECVMENDMSLEERRGCEHEYCTSNQAQSILGLGQNDCDVVNYG